MSFINDVAYYLYITGPIISAVLTFSDNKIIWSIRSCSVAQLCPTLQPHRLQQARFPCPSPGLPEFAQTQVHWVSGAIQPSHPLSSPSPAVNISQHQGLLQWVSSSHQVAKVLELQLQHLQLPVVAQLIKESACNVGDLGSIHGLGRSPGEGSEENTAVLWPGEFHGLYSAWGRKESDTTEWLSLSFRIDWFDLLTVQRTLKSLLQHRSFKVSILQRSVCSQQYEKSFHSLGVYPVP